MARGKKDDPEQIVAKAFAHPMRVRILVMLHERVASPNELAKELDESLNLVAYHIRVLEKYNCIELVDTKPRRGATEHFYRATRGRLLDERHQRRMDTALRGQASGASIKLLGDTIDQAVSAGTFDANHDGRHFSQTPLCLDAEGWQQAGKVIESALQQIEVIQRESAERADDTDVEPSRSALVLMHFEIPAD